jgi:hypothetical protein
MSKIDIAYYFADVILPDEIEIFANEAGRQAVEDLVDGRVEWDDFAIEAPGWLATSTLPSNRSGTAATKTLRRSGSRPCLTTNLKPSSLAYATARFSIGSRTELARH